MNDQDPKQLWKTQPAATAPLTEEELKKRASGFQRGIRLRNLIEVLAAVFVVYCFGRYIWTYPQPLIQLGSALIILATFVVIHQLYRRTSGGPPPSADAALPSRDFHRAQLVRQRDALRSVWLWYIAPFVPGMALFRWGVETSLDASAPFARGLGANLGIAGVLLSIFLINLYSARRLQREIDQLDAES
ncbi:hypothetical protein [Pseudoduganella namucuonensis]|uniref:DUF2975 domain-containing protein n=1 Tax=Pseudoduganella namucuonensis TaxID=1035707 RepID=A0A1I7LIF9_9BURK|nr:hypothetical protein [Pseudoduganella namucuonensis]SFV09444.1 hypothetical protein SAMN05216552_10308 [Pseudoduganella namucuonensis]